MKTIIKKAAKLYNYYKDNGFRETVIALYLFILEYTLITCIKRPINRLRQAIGDSALFWYRYPQGIVMEITTTCNLKCETCRIFGQNTTSPPDVNNQFMDYEVFSKMVERSSRLIKKASQVNFSSSEPLFHKRIFDMIDLVRRYNKNINVKIITNGMLLDEERINKLIERGIRNVSVSLDGCTKETVEAIRTGADFDRIINNIKKLKEMAGEKVRLSTIFVAQKRNIGELLDFVDFCNELDIRTLKVSGIISYLPEHVEHCLYSETGLRDIDELFHQAQQKAENLGIKFSYEPTKIEPKACGLSKTMYIDEKGNICPCVFLAKKTPLTLLDKTGITEPLIWGNVFQDDPGKIWTSEACVSFRKTLRENRVPKECALCGLSYSVIC